MEKTASGEHTRKGLGRSGRSTAAPPKAESKAMNRGLHAAKAAKQDEFYTQYVDIQKEVEAYLEFDADTFRDKVVYCNCDDPFESNFFKYFAANFNKLALKKGRLKLHVQHLARSDIGCCDENVQRTDAGRAGGDPATAGVG